MRDRRPSLRVASFAALLGLAGAASARADSNIVSSPNQWAFSYVYVSETSAPLSVVLENRGDRPGRVVDVSVESLPAANFALLRPLPLPLELPPSGRAMLDVVASPSAAQRIDGVLLITTDNGANPLLRIPLVVFGRPSDLDVEPPLPLTFDFGWVGIGATSATSRRLTFLNARGLAPIRVKGARFTGLDASAFSFASPPVAWPITLNPLDATTFDVRFAPSRELSRGAAVEFATDAPGRRLVTVRLTGSGYPLAIEPPVYEFPMTAIATSSAPAIVQIVNRGGTAVPLRRVALMGADATAFSIDSPGLLSVAPGARASVVLHFSPGRPERYRCNLLVEPESMPPLQAEVIGPPSWPLFDVTPMTVAFGAYPVDGLAGPLLVTVRNGGIFDVELEPLVSSDPAFALDASSLAEPIPSRTSATFAVTFHPTAVSDYRGSIRVGIKGRSTSQFTLSLTGSGYEPVLAPPGGCRISRSRVAESSVMPWLLLAGLSAALRRRAQGEGVGPWLRGQRPRQAELAGTVE